MELTHLAQKILEKAVILAKQRQNSETTALHLLICLLTDAESLLSSILKDQNISLSNLKLSTEKKISTLPLHKQEGHPQLSQDLKEVLSFAAHLALTWGDTIISAEHLLLALIIKSNQVELKQTLSDYKIQANKLEQAIKDNRANFKNPEFSSNKPQAEDNHLLLEKYGQELVSLAREGKIEPVVGRDEEIGRVIRILSRKTKNNPVLVGEPGVGKTAIIEGLAQRILRGDVPSSLKDYKVFSLDLGSLMAGTKYRGEFEERLKSILDVVSGPHEKILMFIDEIHTIVGAGRSEGALDAGNMLKPKLARGELHCIGATTPIEYQKHIEKDAALERRFQPVSVQEPSLEDSLSILRGIKTRFDIHHGVRIQDQALVMAIKLADRYIADRFLPDKAIDLIDEAASAVKTRLDSVPEELDKAQRRLLQLKIEEQALQKENDPLSTERLLTLQAELEEVRQNVSKQQIHWKKIRNHYTALKNQQDKIQKIKLDIGKAEALYDLNLAARLKYKELPEAEKELSNIKTSFENTIETQNSGEEVTPRDIEDVVSRWTSIPVHKINSSEKQKILNLESKLNEKVIGQENAVKTVSKALIRSYSGFKRNRGPLASFLFLGPTGVGKTELARQIAQELFNSPEAFIRLDGSEYSEKHSVAKLIGSPPGYIGYDEGGQLTEAIRRHPYSVILFDEAEKAHPEIFNLMLQIFDEGHLQDAQGRRVNFKNTLFLLTSNLGSEKFLTGLNHIWTPQELTQILRSHFRPEFMNRLDAVLPFSPLTPEHIYKIANLRWQELQNRLKEEHRSAEMMQGALQELARRGYSAEWGVRPVNRVLQEEIETPLAEMVLSDQWPEESSLEIDFLKGQWRFNLRIPESDQKVKVA